MMKDDSGPRAYAVANVHPKLDPQVRLQSSNLTSALFVIAASASDIGSQENIRSAVLYPLVSFKILRMLGEKQLMGFSDLLHA